MRAVCFSWPLSLARARHEEAQAAEVVHNGESILIRRIVANIDGDNLLVQIVLKLVHYSIVIVLTCRTYRTLWKRNQQMNRTSPICCRSRFNVVFACAARFHEGGARCRWQYYILATP